MAASTTKTASQPVTEPVIVTEIPDLAQKSREQLVDGLQQGQQWGIDATQSWVKAVSDLPVMNLSTIPGIPALPDLSVATKYVFDVAADLLEAQRAFVVELTGVLVPAKAA